MFSANGTWARPRLRAVDDYDLTIMNSADASRFTRRPQLDALVGTWGNVGAATPEAKLADVRRLRNHLRAVADSRAGWVIFTKARHRPPSPLRRGRARLDRT